MMNLVLESAIFNFDDFTTKLRTSLTEVSPGMSIVPERMAMAAMSLSQFANDIIKSLACTIYSEIILHQNDTLLVNGTISLPHVAQPLKDGETLLNETLYFECMTNDPRFELNIFGVVGPISAAAVRMQYVIEKIYPTGLFRIAFEFFTWAGDISDDGTAGFDIGTPIPNNSDRFLMAVHFILLSQSLFYCLNFILLSQFYLLSQSLFITIL